MSGRIVYQPPKEHKCSKPPPTAYDKGTVWLCEECSEGWMLHGKGKNRDWYVMSDRAWRKLEATKGIKRNV